MNLLREIEIELVGKPVELADVEGVFAFGVEAFEHNVVPLDLWQLVHRQRVDAFRLVRLIDEIAATSHFHDEAYLALDGYEEESFKHSVEKTANV